MNRPSATTVLLSFCLLLLLSFARCGEGGRGIAYEVTGVAGGEVMVEIHNESGFLERYTANRLPWKTSFTIKEGDDEQYGSKHTGGVYTAYVYAVIVDPRSGSVAVSIYLDGELVRRDSSTADRRSAEAYYLVRL